MHTGCCTPWKMRLLIGGWWPSGEQSITQISSASRPQVGAHLLEAGAVQKAGDRDEADHAAPVRPAAEIAGGRAAAEGVATEHLPRRPAPEINIEVAQMLGVGADAPRHRRLPIVERRGEAGAAILDPAAATLGLLLVRRIADDDGDRLVALDAIGGAAGLGDAGEIARDPRRLLVWIGEGVGDVEPKICAERLVQVFRRLGVALAEGDEIDEFGEHAKLGDRERSELQLEPRSASPTRR